MNFFTNLLNKIRNINFFKKPKQTFIFGSIISGTYTNWKTDPHPTILCLGTFNKNGKWMVHGIQLHNMYSQYLITVIKNIKQNGTITNPINFYNYLKLNYPTIIKECYRTYKMEMTDFKTISPGFSNINEKYCYPISDQRDGFINALKENNNKQIPNINQEELRKNITRVTNTVKIW